MEATPVAKGLFTETADGPRLTGSKCTGCGAAYLPKADMCHNPECPGSAMEDAEFGPTGTLWSVAIQDYPPPPPTRYDEPYQPYAMGVIDTDDGLRVVGRVIADDPRAVEPGTRVTLVIEPMYHQEDGTPVATWMFRITE